MGGSYRTFVMKASFGIGWGAISKQILEGCTGSRNVGGGLLPMAMCQATRPYRMYTALMWELACLRWLFVRH